MQRQVIRKGDVVVFIRAHEHARADQGSFLVEEVIQPGFQSEVGVRVPGDYARTAAAQGLSPTARITPIERRGGDDDDTRSAVGAPWQLVSVDALGHDPKQRGFVPAIIAPGFLGNLDHWCWWDDDYRDDGAIGPYANLAMALAEIESLEREPGVSHFHVAVFQPEPNRAPTPADVRMRRAGEAGKVAWSARRPRKQTEFAERMDALNQHQLARTMLELVERGHASVTLDGTASGWNITVRANTSDHNAIHLAYKDENFYRAISKALEALAVLRPEGK